MKRLLPGIVTLCIALGLAPSLTGQVVGLPVYNAGIPAGIGIYGDVGFPNDAAGDGVAYGITGRLGAGAFGATASLALFNPEGPGDQLTSVGGTLDYKIFGGPLVPLTVTLQGGAGYAKEDDSKFYRYPVGLGFALTIPNPALAIKPWLAPRLDIAHVSNPLTSDTETNFGISGGVELNLLSGFGLHASYDRVFADIDDPAIFAAGLHYTFRVPGL
ncbi:MAG TPA: hypothetical protein VHJ69_10215 [Gemmatimonadales bacterium]|jgi:hypothetical protein|nr:hypothetical protein [Gemmatimonadales bacterium]